MPQGPRVSPVRRPLAVATTLARDLVRRRLPAGASPSRRELAPGRTLSPMPSEQKGAYGGHLASYVLTLHRIVSCGGTYVRSPPHPSGDAGARPMEGRRAGDL